MLWTPSIGRKVGIHRGILPHVQTGLSIGNPDSSVSSRTLPEIRIMPGKGRDPIASSILTPHKSCNLIPPMRGTQQNWNLVCQGSS